jgi:pheromone shutdown protein TraB
MKPYERVIFFIIMTGLWGATTVLIILGIPITIIDSLFGTDLGSIPEMIVAGGNYGLFKIWLCGLPLSFLTDMHKRR